MRIAAALLGSWVVLGSSFALAQAGPGTLRYVPKDADIVVRMAGPAKFGKDFAGTNLGKALSDPQVLPFWGKLLTYYRKDLGLDAENEARLAELIELLKDYSGEVMFAARGDWEEISATNDMMGAAVFAWRNDDTAAKITKLVAEVLPAAEGELEAGGVSASLRNNDGVQWAGPFEHDGHTVLLVGQELAERAKWFFEDLPDPAEVAAMKRGPFAMVMRLQRFLGFAKEMLMLDAMVPGWVSKQLGLDAVDECSFFSFPDGKFVAQEIELKFNGKPRGLVGLVCPPKKGRPTLLDYRPADASNYTVGAFDTEHLMKLYEATFVDYADELEMDRAQVEQMFTQMTKLDLVNDVLAHIGDEYMSIEDLLGGDDVDEDEPESLQEAKERISESCYVVRLKDGKAFAKSLDTAIRARGLHVGRKREKYGDTDIYRMNLLGMLEVEYAVTDKLLILGLGTGEGTKRNVRGVIDGVAAVAAGDAPEFRPAVATRISQLPDGWGGLQVGSLVEILDMIDEAGKTVQTLLAAEGMTMNDMDDSWQLMLDASRALKGVMSRHEVGMIVNLDYYEKDRYVMRSRW